MGPISVVAVVAAYRPDDGLADRLALISPQVASTVVVDDGSGTPAPAGVEFIAFTENRGIAAALNAGIARARELGATHVLTLDQDTELAAGYVTAAVDTFQRAQTTRIGAAVVDVINASPSIPTWHSDDGIPLAPEAIQSGMLVALECIDDAGGLDERLFIDGVDREFCHRIRARGWAVAIARGTSIDHTIGRLVPLRSGGAYEWHEPFRQYYIARNGIIVAQRFRRVEPEWSKTLLRSTLEESWKVIWNGPGRLKHALASLAGLVHGVFGRGGRIPRVLERMLR